jgi:coat protein Gp5
VNTFINPTWVTKDVAVNYKNEIKLIGQFDRTWDKQWDNKPGGAKFGYTVQARIQQRWVVNEGQVLVTQPILNQTAPITLNHQLQVGMEWSSADDTVVVEDVQSRYTAPAGRALAGKADVIAGAEVYKSVYFSIGTPGVPIVDDATYTDGIAKLRNVGVPQDLNVVMDPKSQSRLLAANFALFNPQAQISKYFKSGQFSGAALGADQWYWDPNMPTFTTGTFTTATPVVAGATQTGSSLALSGMGTYAMKAGDVFRIDGVNAVNPTTYADTGDLQDFVLVADLAGTTTGTFSISPPIITSGPLQTVTASPANLAAVSWLGATGTVGATMAATKSKQSLMFNPAAFAYVSAYLSDDLPGAKAKAINDPDAAIAIRMAEQWNIQTDQRSTRLDMLMGVASVLPYFALRIWS